MKSPGRSQLVSVLRALLSTICYQEEAVEVWCRACVKPLGPERTHKQDCPVAQAERMLWAMGVRN